MHIFSKPILILFLLFLISTISKAQLNTLGGIQKTLNSVENAVNSTEDNIKKIDTAFEKIKNNNLYKALIDGKEFTFPVGILPANGDRNYALALNGVSMTPDGMFAEIYMRIEIKTDHYLYFLADRVPFTHSGGIAGEMRLYLLRTDSLIVGNGYAIQFDGLEKGGIEKSCYASFTCKGFKEAMLTGAVNFDKKSIVTDSKTKGQVSVKYSVQADKLSNFIIQLKDIPTFEFANLPGFTCSVPSITLDKSEVKNAPDFTLPLWYKDGLAMYKDSIKDQAISQDNSLLVDGPQWEGVYIPTVTIQIPRGFTEDKGEEVVTVQSKDLIIDQNGISCQNSVSNVLSGKIKGWDYSIDSLRIDLLANALVRGGIHGHVTLPICKEGSQVTYGLLISKKPSDKDLSYFGSIGIDGKLLDAEAFGIARIKLTAAEFDFAYSNEQFYPAAILSGGITLSPSSKSTDTKSFASFGLDFTKLRLSSTSPHISIAEGGGIMMSGTGSMMSNFPVSISQVGINFAKGTRGEERAGIRMMLTVKLHGGKGSGNNNDNTSGASANDGNSFGGAATFTIWAQRDAVSQKWKYSNFELDRILVNFDNTSFKLHGELNVFQDDPVYGKGVCGFLDLNIISKIDVKVGAIFGRKGEILVTPDKPLLDAEMVDKAASYRYWFVDAAATFPVLTVTPFVGINGFTGGIYHNMRLEKNSKDSSNLECKAASGMRYVPDSSIFLGLMAGIGLQSIPTDAVYNGKISFGIEFNDSGGLNMIAFWGGVTLLTPPVKIPGADALKSAMDIGKPEDKQKESEGKVPEESTGSLRVTWFTMFDFPKKTFTGDFDMYMSLYGVVQGGHPNNNAGHIAVLFSPADKYLWVGTPTVPLSINVLSLFTCESYLCAGNKLPSPPMAPLPEEIHATPVDYNALETGAGLSFGARVIMNAEFSVGADFAKCSVSMGAKAWFTSGFDVLISKSNQPVYCNNTGGARGIHDWYATGQAFISGGFQLGGGIKCLGISKDFNLVSASMSAYVFAQLPKPSYLTGNLNAQFKIVGIKGSVDINVRLGEQCDNAALDKNIVFIESIMPDSGSTKIKVSEKVVVNFTKPIEKFVFNLPNETDKNGGTLPYRAMVEAANIDLSSNGKAIEFTLEWNDSKNQLYLKPLHVLPEDANITVVVNVQLQYQQGGNWNNSGGVKEQRAVLFHTDKEPTSIELANVAYAYPLPGMNNYYRKEATEGYIKLSSLPRKCMQLAPNYTFHIVLIENYKEVARSKNVKVHNAIDGEQFTFSLPNEALGNDKSYQLMLVKVPSTVQKMDISRNNYGMGTVGGTSQDSVILQYTFRTSRFDSFSQKISAYNQRETDISGYSIVQSLTPAAVGLFSGSTEGFASEETSGFFVGSVKNTRPLLRANGADFCQGLSMIGNVPDSVSYSFYGGKLLVQYDVFAELHDHKQQNNHTSIVCTVDDADKLVCTNTATEELTIPKATYYYKLAYFLPGRDTKTSEVSMSFDLPKDLKL